MIGIETKNNYLGLGLTKYEKFGQKRTMYYEDYNVHRKQ